MEGLEKRQEALDRDALEEARERLKKAARRTPLRLLRKYWKAVAQGVRKAQKRAEEGANWPYIVPLVAIDAEKLALITLATTLKRVGDPETARFGPSVASVLREIAQWCWYENVCDKLQNRERNLAYALARRNKNPWHARRRASNMIAEFREERWGDTDMGLQLGGALLEIAIKATGLFAKQPRPKASSTIQLTLKGKEEVEKLRTLDELLLVPIRRPRVLPPVPWTGPRGGGTGDGTLDMVSAHKSGPPTTSLAHGDLGIACRALNAFQETPWRINRRLFEIMRRAWASGEPKEVLPPPLPDVAGFKNLSARWVREILSARDGMDRRLALARRFLDDAEIYYPWHLDWRGRAYAIPQTVHPQADDGGRALIEFARGKPLGERGAHWLAVHLANLWGRDGVNHMSFDERVKWVKDHQAEILDSAARPLEGKKFWTRAKKPWRFLAAAMEWAGYAAEGPGYVSRQPIAMDGTCNVHQHLSALGRDPVGGKFTNLVPGPVPEDIYQKVADRIARYVDQDALGEEEIAWEWQGAIDRALVKQPTMTAPYGVTHKGVRDQIRTVIRDEYPDEFMAPWLAAEYLARLLKDAVAETAVKAVEITDWLRKCAKLLGKKKRGLSWLVPTGFRVTNLYPKMVGHRVRTALITLATLRPHPGGKIDLTDAANGIVANLVHSLDAAHMMLTVCELHSKGLRDFGMVHDSYAVHACDVDLMNEVLRAEFVRVHTEFTLATLYDEMKASAPGIDLPPPPAPGTLDLAEVRRSLYLFS